MAFRLRIQREAITLVVIATLAMAACFVPLNEMPRIWSTHGLQMARKVALGVFGVTIVLALLSAWAGRMARLMLWASAAMCLLLVSFCVFRFAVLTRGPMPDFAEDDPRARPYYQEACDRGNLEGCIRLGACYWTGTCRVTKDVRRALGLFEKACDGGHYDACGQMGACFEVGGCGLRKNAELATTLYEKGCGGGEMSSCNNLGVCYFYGRCGLYKDDNLAAGFFRKACDGGDGSACSNLDFIKK